MQAKKNWCILFQGSLEAWNKFLAKIAIDNCVGSKEKNVSHQHSNSIYYLYIIAIDKLLVVGY